MPERWPQEGTGRVRQQFKVGPRGHRVKPDVDTCMTCGDQVHLTSAGYWRHIRAVVVAAHPPRIPRLDLLPNRVGMQLSPRDLESVRAYALTGNYKVAAHSIGMKEATLRHHMHRAFQRLDVDGAIDAFRVLGWLEVPND